MNTQDFRSVLGHFATGVCVVTSVDNGEPVGFTCQSLVSVSLDPPFVTIAPSKASTSWPRIARTGYFCVNILADTQADVAITFATRGADKFAELTWLPDGHGSPIIDGALAWVECSLELAHDAGDHEIILGRVSAFGEGEGQPLIFYKSQYVSISEFDQ